MKRFVCNDGWICEKHPDQAWPHEDCPGPGQLCADPDCLAGRLRRAELDARRAEPRQPD
jgi:hypothetical protein